MGERSVNELLEQALLLARVDGQPKEIVLEKNLGTDLPEVRAESQKLVQAFLNLLLNAIQAVDSQGTVRVSTKKFQSLRKAMTVYGLKLRTQVRL